MGRRKIEIQPLGDERTKTVTFVKRKAGLFKKAYELSVLCEVDMAVIIIGSDRIYEYSSVDTKELMNYYKRQAPHELKLPEDYGEYKKRATLRSGSLAALAADDMPLEDMQGDSDYESGSPEPKRQKKGTAGSPASIYAKQPPVNSQFVKRAAVHNASQHNSADTPLQRPVLRVQIPSDAKSQPGSIDTITPTDGNLVKKEKLAGSADGHGVPPPPLNAARFSFNSKFRSPETKKQMPQLHVPMSKLQSLSPSTGAMPQLPINGSAGFFSSLPPPSPSGQYPPSILPTPVFNQVFNQQYMNGMALGAQNLAQGQGNGNMTPGIGSVNVSSNMPQGLGLPTVDGTTGTQGGTSGEPDTAKFRPPLQQHFMNGEQTPVSGLPSRYMNEIFPSPSNLYPSQEWPTGLTPYSSTMSHYFAGMPPSASGLTPHPMNAAFANNNRTLLPMTGQRPMPMRAASSLNVPSQPQSQEEHQEQLLSNTVTQPSSSEFLGQYYKK